MQNYLSLRLAEAVSDALCIVLLDRFYQMQSKPMSESLNNALLMFARICSSILPFFTKKKLDCDDFFRTLTTS